MKDTTWKCYYLASDKKHNQIKSERIFKGYEYTQPVLGGQLELSTQLFEDYEDILSSMTVAKYNTALLLSLLNKRNYLYIQEKAVNQAVRQIYDSTAYQHWLAHKNSAFYNEKITLEQHLIKLLATLNKFSVVAYPVCYHYDIFKDRAPSLENKICFSFASESNESIGRGGDGPGRFVFALLDWQNKVSGTRRRKFIAAGGLIGHNEWLTLDHWVNLFGFHWDNDYNP